MRQTVSNDRLVSYFCYMVVDKSRGAWKGLIGILVLVKREDGIGMRNWRDMIIILWRSAHEVNKAVRKSKDVEIKLVYCY